MITVESSALTDPFRSPTNMFELIELNPVPTPLLIFAVPSDSVPTSRLPVTTPAPFTVNPFVITLVLRTGPVILLLTASISKELSSPNNDPVKSPSSVPIKCPRKLVA